jgi:hypothetical protein
MFHPTEDPEPPSATDLAFRSVDEVVNALYASISFDDGTQPDWTTFRRLFEPGARMVRVGGSDVLPSDVEGFCSRFDELVAKGQLLGFDERELSRRTEVWSDIAQVFSTYERRTPGQAPARGINAIQMYNDGRRWWILSISWHDEKDGARLPSRYLPRAN